MDKIITTLNLSESFYSIQAEGVSTGSPAYFIRLKGCNLSCGFSNSGIKALKEELKKEEGRRGGGDHSFADLYKEGKATWCCDSASVWLTGNKTSHEDMWNMWVKDNIFNWIIDGRVHLIWTGGEPTMPQHQKAIVSFINATKALHKSNLFNEIETNGTYVIEEDLLDELNQINCSVKLQNSGMDKNIRIVPDAINSIQSHPNHWFKFVVSTKEDMNEIIKDFVEPFNINPKRVCMMPGLDRAENFNERTKFIMELAKQYGFKGLSRLHIAAWDQATGV